MFLPSVTRKPHQIKPKQTAITRAVCVRKKKWERNARPPLFARHPRPRLIRSSEEDSLETHPAAQVSGLNCAVTEGVELPPDARLRGGTYAPEPSVYIRITRSSVTVWS